MLLSNLVVRRGMASCGFSASEPSAWCLWGRGTSWLLAPVRFFIFLNVMRFSYRDTHTTGLNWADDKLDIKYIMIISLC